MLTGTMVVFLIACLLGGYLLGSLNASIIIGKVLGVDIRKEGSKNAGMTNALRVLGKKTAAMVFLFDLLKAIISVLLAGFAAKALYPEAKEMVQFAQYLSGFGAVLGHNFPVYFGFRGGKGILASWGVIMILDYRIALLLLLVFALVVSVTRYVSLASITSAILYPLFVIAFNVNLDDVTVPYYIALSLVVSVLAIYRHRANISRLKSGTESKLGAKAKKE